MALESVRFILDAYCSKFAASDPELTNHLTEVSQNVFPNAKKLLLSQGESLDIYVDIVVILAAYVHAHVMLHDIRSQLLNQSIESADVNWTFVFARSCSNCCVPIS
jgi:hypothetical protein